MEGYHEAKNSVFTSLGLRPSTEALNIGPQLLGLLVSHQSSTPPSLGKGTNWNQLVLHGERERKQSAYETFYDLI